MEHVHIKNSHKEKPQMPLLAFFSDSKKEHLFFKYLDAQDRAYCAGYLKDFKAHWLEISKVTLPSHPKKAVIFFGLGEKKSWTRRHMVLAFRKIVHYAKVHTSKVLSVCIDDFRLAGLSADQTCEAFAHNAEIAAYEFTRYREEPKGGWPHLDRIEYYAKGVSGDAIQKALDRGQIIGEQVNAARTLSNIPGGDMTPKFLADSAREQGKKYGFTVTVLGEKEMKKLKMGAILGVSKGSAQEAQLIVMEYLKGAHGKKPLAFVGKGITFDSGGLNLKPSGALDEMHMDMSGGAAVIAAMGAIARLALKVNVVGVIPAVENMLSGESYRPGDVLYSMSGKTIEVANTDAEGRVVLSDALTYTKKYSPSLVIDVATLTGACMVALGKYASGVFSRDEKLVSTLRALGEISGDYLWPLPMWEEYEDELKGKVGDLLNANKNRYAGATNGALFLHQFAKDFPRWAHIDIAPTMTTSQEMFLNNGARGSGVALLIELARFEK